MQGEYGKIEDIDGVLYCDAKRLSKLIDVSKARISQLTSEGTLLRDDTEFGKLYNMDEAVHAYQEKITQSDNAEDAKIRRDRAKAETSIKASKAMIANLEAQELKGKMYRAEDIQAITEDFLYEIRSAINSLPGQLAVEMVNVPTAAECAVIIQTGVNRMLIDLQKYRFDRSKYEERIRNRQSWDLKEEEDFDE